MPQADQGIPQNTHSRKPHSAKAADNGNSPPGEKRTCHSWRYYSRQATHRKFCLCEPNFAQETFSKDLTRRICSGHPLLIIYNNTNPGSIKPILHCPTKRNRPTNWIAKTNRPYTQIILIFSQIWRTLKYLMMAINSILLPDSQRSYYGSKQDQWRKVWWQTNSSPANVSQNEKVIKQTKKWFNMTNTHSWGGITPSFTGSGNFAQNVTNTINLLNLPISSKVITAGIGVQALVRCHYFESFT